MLHPENNILWMLVKMHKMHDKKDKKKDRKGGVAGTGAVKILALPKRGGGLTYAKIFLVDL